MIRKIVYLIIIASLLLPIINEGKEKENEMIIEGRDAFLSSHPSFISDFIHNICSSLTFHPPSAIASVKTEGREAIFRAYGSSQYRWDFDNDGIWDTEWLSLQQVKHVYEKPYNGFARLQVKNEYGIAENLVRVIAVMQEEDQKQEKTEDFVKIYGSKKYAQTFIPTMLNLTGIKIYVARKGITCNEMPFLKILSKLFPNLFHNFFLGDLYIKIYEGKPSSGKMLTYVKIEADDVSKAGAWISIDFPKGLLISEWNNYCSIAVEQDGGNERNYYKWYYAYNDPYPNGSFYYYGGGRWKEDSTRDFAFITYGKPTGNEPDGIEERWAVLIAGPDVHYADDDMTDMKNVLINRGWNPSHIWTIYSDESSLSNVEKAIMQMKENEDMDDICLIGWRGHGAFRNGEYYIYLHGTLKGEQLDEWLDGFSCKGMLLIAHTCQSGGAIYSLAQEKRVIITSCDKDEASYNMGIHGYNGILYYFLSDETGIWSSKKGFPPLDPIVGRKDGAFARTDPDTSNEYGGNNDGWVSAEEAYRFAYKWVKKTIYELSSGQADMNPQFFDGYNGDLKIARIQ